MTFVAGIVSFLILPKWDIDVIIQPGKSFVQSRIFEDRCHSLVDEMKGVKARIAEIEKQQKTTPGLSP